MIEFTRWWLLLLIPLPLFARYALPALPVMRAVVLPRGVLQALTSVAPPFPFGLSRWTASGIAAATGWLALLFALAQPVMRVDELPWRSGQSIVVAVDLSASMGQVPATGAVESRFQTVRRILGDFISQREGDRVALVAFANDAYLVSPFTYDTRAVIEVMTELNIGLPGRKTDLGQPIGLAVKLVRDDSDANTTMVIVTDGETNTGQLSATDASRLAEQLGMTVHVIGFSSTVKPENRAYMREIAQLGGGQYAEAQDSTQLQQIYSELARREIPSGQDRSAQPQRLIREFTWVPLLLALSALLVYSLRLRREQ